MAGSLDRSGGQWQDQLPILETLKRFVTFDLRLVSFHHDWPISSRAFASSPGNSTSAFDPRGISAIQPTYQQQPFFGCDTQPIPRTFADRAIKRLKVSEQTAAEFRQYIEVNFYFMPPIFIRLTALV